MSIRIGILGYGNLGRGVECAIKHNPDMELVGVFTRRAPESVKILTETAKVYSVDDAEKMKDQIDVMILCGGSATDLPEQTPKYAQWFNVVDSFDTHKRIPEHFANVDKAASESGHVGIISVGWDPGMFSLNRMYANAILTNGKDYTFWGKGVSQGHSDAIRRIKGVKDGKQYTIPVESALEAVNCAAWLQGLILDGIVAGVGAVLGFVPQMLVLFLFLAFLESCGYMARVAFIMDRIFRKFGLSGKSFIPMLIGSGCGVPGVMASRTIENDRDRKMTIMTTTFVPCGAKLPIIAMIAGAFFNNSGWVATSSYFVGIAAIICSGIILKKTKMFAGEPAPFVMELPAYHWPTVGNILRSMWERGWSFIKKAGTIILLSTIVLWFLMGFGWEGGSFGMVEELNNSILAKIGSAIAWIFAPLGWTKAGEGWKMAVAAVTGLIAKENVVATFGMLFGFAEVAEDGAEIWGNLAQVMTPIAAYGFLVFNLLCAPCFAAMGAIKREMNNAKWFWFAIVYQCGLAYVVSLCIYQIGTLLTGGGFGIGTVVAFVLVAAFLYLLFRPYKESNSLKVNTKSIA